MCAWMRQNRDQKLRRAKSCEVAIFIGAGLGGVTRHHFNALAVGLFGTSFSWGIFAINVMGSVVMGVIAEWLALRGSASGSSIVSHDGHSRRLHYLLDVLARCCLGPFGQLEMIVAEGFRGDRRPAEPPETTLGFDEGVILSSLQRKINRVRRETA